MSGNCSTNGPERKRKSQTDWKNDESSESEGSQAAASDPDWGISNCQVVEVMTSHSSETGKYTDICFKVGSAWFIVNGQKEMLMIKSEVFAAMFSSRWIPADPYENQIIARIPVRSFNTFKHFLMCLHSNPLSMDIGYKGLLDVLELAHLYQVHELIYKCSKAIKLYISHNSCVEIYQWTRVYTELKLSDWALDYIHRNIPSIASSDQFLLFDVAILAMLTDLLKNDNITINEIELFNALLRWGNVKDTVTDQDGKIKQRKEGMQSLIPSIRFLLMSLYSVRISLLSHPNKSSQQCTGLGNHAPWLHTKCEEKLLVKTTKIWRTLRKSDIGLLRKPGETDNETRLL